MTPSDKTPLAPNLADIHARIVSVQSSAQFDDKLELTFEILHSTPLDGPDFTTRHQGTTVAGFTFNPPFTLTQGSVITAQASYLGGPHSGYFHLTHIARPSH